jgi:tetraacyldisaccharide-1-P 4'-kinase
LVVEVCRRLKKRGLRPVVLTRGYARRLKRPIWIRPTEDSQGLALWDFATQSSFVAPEERSQTLADLTGDEALEIAFLAGVDVLVGARRHTNAQSYLESIPLSKSDAIETAVFVLDDGFQHWSLQRDTDIVVIRAEDLSSALLPLGPLREDASALKRADLVLELGKDVFKRSYLSDEIAYDRSEAWVLTTRAPDPDFEKEIRSLLGERPFRTIALRDHANREEMLEALGSFSGTLFVGWKEFSKLLSRESLASRDTPRVNIKVPRDKIVVIGLRLDFSDSGAALERTLEEGLARASKRLKGNDA